MSFGLILSKEERKERERKRIILKDFAQWPTDGLKRRLKLETSMWLELERLGPGGLHQSMIDDRIAMLSAALRERKESCGAC